MKEERDDRKNKRRAIFLTGVFQLLLLIIFYLMVVWEAPIPPNPEYGVELSFLQASTASSSSSTSSSTSKSKLIEDDNNLSETQTSPTENSQQNATEEQTNLENEVVENFENTIPDPVNSNSENVTSESTEEVAETIEETVIEPETASSENAEEIITEEPILENTSENLESEAEDESEQEEIIDERALYGNQGTSENSGTTEGANLSLAGWIWDFKPKPDDTSDESGKIVYQIVVDSDGYLVKIETLVSTVSPAVERKYRNEVERLTFSKTIAYKSAPLSTGTITFIIKTK